MTRHLSYADLERLTCRVAAALQTHGIGPGQVVAVHVERALELPAVLLGVLRAGAAYLPLDPEFPAERIAFMLSDSGAAAVITQQGLNLDVGDFRGPTLYLETLGDGEPRAVEDDPERPAYIIYTSGSTGRPKGVVIPHRALCNFLDGILQAPGLTDDEALLAVTTISFDIAALELYLPLIRGARLVIASREVAADGHALAECLLREGIGTLQATPATWRMLLAAGWPGASGFRALCGGEALTGDLVDALSGRVGEIWNLYGPTETTIWSTVWRVDTRQERVLVGRPIANTRCYVLDHGLLPVPPGVTGELWIGGAGVAIGYHGRPELNAERFRSDPFDAQAGGRMYRTGDLARWTIDGNLECLGRTDGQVKLRGFRIELGEIESALGSQDEISECACGVRERGPGDARLVAWIVARDGAAFDAGTIRTALRRSLPAYMVPQTFRVLDALPRLPNGKLDRRSLPDPFQDMAEDRTPRRPPATPAEKAIAEIWAEVLGSQDIGADDRFIDLGGHSLLAVQVATRVRQRFDTRLPLRSVMTAPLHVLAAMLPAAAPEVSNAPCAPAVEVTAAKGGTLSRLRRWFK